MRKSPNACQECGRNVGEEMTTVAGRPYRIKLNRAGLCQVCVEVFGEAAADDDAILAKADRIRARRAAAR